MSGLEVKAWWSPLWTWRLPQEAWPRGAGTTTLPGTELDWHILLARAEATGICRPLGWLLRWPWSSCCQHGHCSPEKSRKDPEDLTQGIWQLELGQVPKCRVLRQLGQIPGSTVEQQIGHHPRRVLNWRIKRNKLKILRLVQTAFESKKVD